MFEGDRLGTCVRGDALFLETVRYETTDHNSQSVPGTSLNLRYDSICTDLEVSQNCCQTSGTSLLRPQLILCYCTR